MIRRDAGSHFLLITQHDHATLSGELAGHLGNAAFAGPSPVREVVEGIAHHDAGWPLHDDEPTLNQDGLPLHVFEVPGVIAIGVWSASVDRAATLGPYQGLLVSLHVLGLSAYAQSHMSQRWSRQDAFGMNKFQHRQVEIQERLRREVGLDNEVPLHLGLAKLGTSAEDDRLLFNFRLLTAMDRVSLALCCGTNLFRRMDDVHAAPGRPPAPIAADMPDAGTMTLTPWPFDLDEVRLTVPARRVRKEPFASVVEFRAAYQQSPVESLELRVARY